MSDYTTWLKYLQSAQGQSDLASTAATTGAAIENWGNSDMHYTMAMNGPYGSALYLLDAAEMLRRKDWEDDSFGTKGHALKKVGLMACGGKKYGIGGDLSTLLGSAGSIAKVTSYLAGTRDNSYNNYMDFHDALDDYYQSYSDYHNSLDDNDSIQMAYSNAVPVAGHLRGRDISNRSFLDRARNIAAATLEMYQASSGLSGFSPSASGTASGAFPGVEKTGLSTAGHTFTVPGKKYGGKLNHQKGIGGFLTLGTALSSVAAEIADAINAKGYAEGANQLMKRKNAHMYEELYDASMRADDLNDRQRFETYLNTNLGNPAAFGGDLSTHGVDFSNGLTFIDAGGTHEDNPYGGVPAGRSVDGEENLVEEGEVVYNDYVFSDRINIPEDLQKKYKLGGNLTFAEAVKKLTKPTLERPNDPISKDTNKAILGEFMEKQEEIRQFEQMKAAIEEALMRQQLSEQLREAGLQQPEEPQEALYPPQEPQEPRQLEMVGEPEQENAEPGVPGMAFGGHKFAGGGYYDKITWDKYSKDAVEEFLRKQLAAYNGLNNPEAKEAKREEIISFINNVQNLNKQGYDRYNGKRAKKDKDIETLQEAWRAVGNKGFESVTEDTGYNPIKDNLTGNWVDGYWGPMTNVRRFWSDADDSSEAAKLLAQMGIEFEDEGLDYGPEGKLLTVRKKNDNVGLQEEQAPAAETQAKPSVITEEAIKAAQRAQAPIEGITDIRAGSTPPSQKTPRDNTYGHGWSYDPATAATLYGALSSILGGPDYSRADSIVAAARRAGRPMHIPVETVGDYIAERPIDEKALVNLLNSNRLHAAREAMNISAGNKGMQLGAAASIDRDFQATLAEALARTYLSNRQDKLQSATFNTGTNRFNAQSINQRNAAEAQLNSSREGMALNGIISGNTLGQRIFEKWDDDRGQNISALAQNLDTKRRERIDANSADSLRGLFGAKMNDDGTITFDSQDDLLNVLDLYSRNKRAAGVTSRPTAQGGNLKRKRRF